MGLFTTIVGIAFICWIVYKLYERYTIFFVATEIPGTELTLRTFFFGDMVDIKVLTEWRFDFFFERNFKRHNSEIFRIIGPIWTGTSVEAIRICTTKYPEFWSNAKIPIQRSTLGWEEIVPKSVFALPADGSSKKGTQMWASHRRTVSALFGKKHLSEYYNNIQEPVQNFLENYNSAAEVCNELATLALKILGKVLFGFDFYSAEKQNNDYCKAAKHYELSVLGLALLGWAYRALNWWPLQKSKAIMEGAVKAAFKNSADTGERNICTALKRKKDPRTGKTMGMGEITDEMTGLFLAGHETTGNTMAWMLYILALNPEMQQKCKKALQEQIKGDDPTFEEVDNNELLLRIVHECMALRPIVYWFIRTVTKPYKFEHLGYSTTLPKGVRVLWYRRPTDFKEFNPFRVETHKEIASDAMPFGFGRRKCVGYRFAELETTIFLANLLQKYTVQFGNTGKHPKPVFAVTAKPAELFLEIKKDEDAMDESAI